MTTLQTLAAFTAETELTSLPESARDTLRLHLLDTVGAILAGATTAEAAAIVALVADSAAPGPVVATGLPLRTSLGQAALASCAATRCTEVDDIDLESCTTPGSVVVPTALAVARTRDDLDAATFLAALAVGYEVLTRFGRAARGPEILYRGVWPTYLAAALGAAAVTARLLALSADTTAHALAAALTLTSGTSARVRGLSSRWLTLGCAAQNGILAALGARHGLRGELTLLDGAWSRMTGIELDAATLTSELGNAFAVERVSIKPYCAAKQVTAAICAFRELLAEGPVSPDSISEVVVAVPPPYAAMIDQPAPVDRIGTIASARYQLALAALDSASLLDVRREPVHAEPAFQALHERVTVVADPDLLGPYPRAWPARVAVTSARGTVSRTVIDAPGDPTRPYTWDATARKLQLLLEGHRAEAQIDALANVCRGLAEHHTLAELLDALDYLS